MSSNTPTRVLLLTTSFPMDQDSTSGIFVARLLDAMPHSVEATVLAPATSGAAQPFSRGRHRVHPVRYAPRRMRKLAQGAGGIPAAIRTNPLLIGFVPLLLGSLLFKALRYSSSSDVIHANWSVCGIVGGLVGRLSGVPVVTTLRGDDVSRSVESTVFRGMLRVCVHLSDRVVAVGDGIAEQIRALVPASSEKLSVIPNGVDRRPVRARTLPPSLPLRLVSVGSLIPRKGFDTAIRAVANTRDPSAFRLHIVGSGTEHDRLKQLAIDLGVQGQVEFTGSLSPNAVWGELDSADLFVLASRSEGRPNALMEAMASGRAVVASDIPGVRELVEDGENGHLFPADDAKALATALDALLSDPAQIQRMGSRARESVETRIPQWRDSADSYVRLYRGEAKPPEIPWEILACPSCSGLLSRVSEGASCRECEELFPSEGGCLDLRLRRPKRLTVELELRRSVEIQQNVEFGELETNENPERDLHGVPLPPHLTSEMASHLPAPLTKGGRCLDVGCGRGEYRAVVEELGYEWVGVDTATSSDIAGDAHALPFSDESFDLVVSLSALEHFEFPTVALGEMLRVLRPGGTILGSVATLVPFHGSSSYYNMTHYGVASALATAGFDIQWVKADPSYGAVRAIAFSGLFLGMPRRVAYGLVEPLRWAQRVWWSLARRIRSDLFGRDREALLNSGSMIFLARRPATNSCGSGAEVRS